MEAWEKEVCGGVLFLANSPTVISRTISFPLQHPGYPSRGLGKVREEMELKSGGGEEKRCLGPWQGRRWGPGRVARRGQDGRPQNGRKGRATFWKVLVLSRGVFLRNSHCPPPGRLAGALPRPFLQSRSQGARVSGRPGAARPPALRQPRGAGLSRLLRRGKAHARGLAGGEPACAEGEPLLRESQTAAACQLRKPGPAVRAGDGAPGKWLLRRAAELPRRRAAAGNPRAADRSRPRGACLLPSKGKDGTFEPFTLKWLIVSHQRAAPPPVPTSAAFPGHLGSQCARRPRGAQGLVRLEMCAANASIWVWMHVKQTEPELLLRFWKNPLWEPMTGGLVRASFPTAL